MLRILGLASILGILVSTALLAQSSPLFSEFQVATQTTGDQKAPCAAIDAAGNFAIGWNEPQGVLRNFDAAGTAGGPEADLATDHSGFHNHVRCATNASGQSVAVWTGFNDGRDVFARLFDASGPVGSQFQVDTYATGEQYNASVAIDPTGKFVVVWQSFPNQDGDFAGVFGQRFDAAGAKVGTEFQVNTYTTGAQDYPDVAMDGSGRFVVVWQSDKEDGNDLGVFGRRYAADGTPLSGEFQVNIFTGSYQFRPRVASDAAGDFTVVWGSQAEDGSGIGVFGRRFDASGNAKSAEFRANTYAFGPQTFPAIGMDSAGNFLIAWQSEAQDNPAEPGGQGVFAKQFDGKTGRPIGGEFAVNTYTTNDQRIPSVALDDAGRFVIAWQSTGQDGSGYGVFARRGGFPPPAALAVDARSVAGTSSNVNGVLEPGERVSVEPAWRNSGTTTLPLTGTASDLAGPPGATHTLNDTTADYGSLAAGATHDCFGAAGNCYQVSVSAPAVRPATHWDLTFSEALSTGASKTWTLHVGASFPDVPVASPFYKKIEAMLHTGITSGCDATHYCPGQPVPRSQMAIFLAKAIVGGPPGLTEQFLIGGKYYDCALGGATLFTDVAGTDTFCRHVHVLAAQNVTLGCSPTLYCPNDIVSRLQMAALIAKAMVAPAGGAGVPLAYGPDPVTGLSYSCNAGSPDVHFTDVPASSDFCKHVHFLWAKGVVAGCAATLYCPADPVTRDQMAKFLGNAFALKIYGP